MKIKFPWFVVQNGKQIDIHYKDTEQDREFTVVSDVKEDTAKLIVAAVNSYDLAHLFISGQTT